MSAASLQRTRYTPSSPVAAPTPSTTAWYVGAASSPTARLSRSSGLWASANATDDATDATIATASAPSAKRAASWPREAAADLVFHQASAVHATAPTRRAVTPQAQRVR